jgi:multiple sugar transport system ATP-binding protein
MGADNLIWCADGDLTLEVRVAGDQTIATGTRLGLNLDPQRVSLFAPDGARL